MITRGSKLNKYQPQLHGPGEAVTLSRVVLEPPGGALSTTKSGSWHRGSESLGESIDTLSATQGCMWLFSASRVPDPTWWALREKHHSTMPTRFVFFCRYCFGEVCQSYVAVHFILTDLQVRLFWADLAPGSGSSTVSIHPTQPVVDRATTNECWKLKVLRKTKLIWSHRMSAPK